MSTRKRPPKLPPRPGLKDHTCPSCGKILGRYRVLAGAIEYETKCRHCKSIVVLKEAA